MPSFAIPKFTVLLEPLWVSAEFLLLSTGTNLDGTSCFAIQLNILYANLMTLYSVPAYKKQGTSFEIPCSTFTCCMIYKGT